MRILILCIIALYFLSGCATPPVQHTEKLYFDYKGREVTVIEFTFEEQGHVDEVKDHFFLAAPAGTCNRIDYLFQWRACTYDYLCISDELPNQKYGRCRHEKYYSTETRTITEEQE